MSDEKLTLPESSQLGERFVPLFAQSRDDIFAYIFSLLPNWSDAEDVFQQTSLVLWQKFGEFEPNTDFRAWACSVAFNTVRNFRRVRGRDRLQFDDALVATLAQERLDGVKRDSDRPKFLADCMAKLPSDHQTLLRRAYADENSVKGLAEAMNRSPQTIYNRLNLIRRSLIKCLQLAMRQRD